MSDNKPTTMKGSNTKSSKKTVLASSTINNDGQTLRVKFLHTDQTLPVIKDHTPAQTVEIETDSGPTDAKDNTLIQPENIDTEFSPTDDIDITLEQPEELESDFAPTDIVDDLLEPEDIESVIEPTVDRHETPDPPYDLETATAQIDDGGAENKSLLVTIGRGLAFSVLLAAAVHFFHGSLWPSNNAPLEDFDTLSRQKPKPTFHPPHSVVNRSIEIEGIVSNLMKDAVWDIHKIHFFKTNWMRLDAKKQAALSHEQWFKEFQNAVDRQLNTPAVNSPSTKAQTLARNLALMELQPLLANAAAADTSVKIADNKAASKDMGKHGGASTANRREKLTAEPVSRSTHSTLDAQVSKVPKPQEIPGQQLRLPMSAENQHQALENSTTLLKAETAVSIPAKIKKMPQVAAAEHLNIEKPENNVINAELAKTTQVQAKLATEKPQHSGRAQPKQPKQLTASEQQTTDIPKSEPNTIAASDTNVPTAENHVAVKKYYYVNGSIESLRSNKPQDLLTVAEINDLVVQLTSDYEKGDFKGFTSLFSSDPAQENHKALIQIQKQFKKWLSGTSDRQMFLKELNWAFSKNTAIGMGKLSLTLISDNQPRIVTINKSISIKVRKDHQKVYITRFEQFEL